MTNKKKRKAKSISAKTGMSHAAAMNQLNKTEPPKPIEYTRWRPTKPEPVHDMDLEIQEALSGPFEPNPDFEEFYPQNNNWTSTHLWDVNTNIYEEKYTRHHPTNQVGPQHHGPVGPWDPEKGRFPLRPAAPLNILIFCPPPETYRGFHWIPLTALKESDFELFEERLAWYGVDHLDLTEIELKDLEDKHNKSAYRFREVGAPSKALLADSIHRQFSDPQGIPLVFSDEEPDSEGNLRAHIRTTKEENLDVFKGRFKEAPLWLQEIAFTGKLESKMRRVLNLKTGDVFTEEYHIDYGSRCGISNILGT